MPKYYYTHIIIITLLYTWHIGTAVRKYEDDNTEAYAIAIGLYYINND